MPARRFPPPWTIEELDAFGQKLAYVYFEEEPGWRSARDEGTVSVSDPNSFC
jgi:hypothetical protein